MSATYSEAIAIIIEFATSMDVFEDPPLCVTKNRFPTEYNDNPAVPAYPGIMFDVSSRIEMELYAMEIDVRLEEATTMDVEIFTTPGSFLPNINNESEWTKLADVTATVAPDGRGIFVPEQDFALVKMKAFERRSFYIQMEGPWIDTKAEALDKTGEVQQQSDDLTVFVGVGLNSRFPEDFDKTVDPQFAGVFHYRKPNECDEEVISTAVEFPLLVSQPPNAFFLNLIKDALDEIVRDALLKSTPFSTMTAESDLQVGSSTKVTSIPSDMDCPETWLHCPTVKPILSFTHQKQLRAGQLRYHILRAKDAIVKSLKQKLQINGILYLGLQPVASSFDITLTGTSGDVDDEARDFFERVVTQVLDETVREESSFVTVLDTAAARGSRRRALRGMSEALSISGEVFGAQASYFPLSDFAIELNSAVLEERGQVMRTLRLGQHISSEGHVFSSPSFTGITDFQASFSPAVVSVLSLGPERERVLDTKILLILISVVLAIFFVFFGYLSRKRAKERRKYKVELQEYRDQMRQQRREKRDGLQKSLDQKSDGECTSGSFENNFSDDLEAAFELGYGKYKEAVEGLGEKALSADQLADTDDADNRGNAERGVVRRRSSASGLSLSLEQDEVQSDLEDDFSDSTSEDGGSVSGTESVVSSASRVSTASSKSLLSVFMEKQAEKQKLQGFHMKRPSSVASSMSESVRRGPSVKSDPLRSQSDHIPKRNLSYMGNQYAADKSQVRRTVSGDTDVRTGRTRNVESMRSKSFDGTFPQAHPSRCYSLHQDQADLNRQLSASAHSYTERRIYLTSSTSRSICSSRSVSSAHSNQSNRTAPVTQTNTATPLHSKRTEVEPASHAREKKADLPTQLSQRFEHLLPPSAQAKEGLNKRCTDQETEPAARTERSHCNSSTLSESASRRTLPARESRTIIPVRRDSSALRLRYEEERPSELELSPDKGTADEHIKGSYTKAIVRDAGPEVSTSPSVSTIVNGKPPLPEKRDYLQEFLDSDEEDDDDDTQVMTTSPSSANETPTPPPASSPPKLTVDDFIRRIDRFQQQEQLSRSSGHHEESSLSGAESLDSIFLDPPTTTVDTIPQKEKKKKKKKSKKSTSSSSTITASMSSSGGYGSSDEDLSCTKSLDDNILLHGETKKKKKLSKKAPPQIIVAI